MARLPNHGMHIGTHLTHVLLTRFALLHRLLQVLMMVYGQNSPGHPPRHNPHRLGIIQASI